jgi:undecaprenyl-diphosphatase
VIIESEIVKAVIMGIVEGLTEFLPISSTGHLILAGQMLSFTGEKAKLFEVFIQLGAILAVVYIYRKKIFTVIKNLVSRDNISIRFIMNLLIAFMPAAVIGFLTHKYIKAYLFSPFTVCVALILGGCAMIFIEKLKHSNAVQNVDRIPNKTALIVGLSQILALFPGVSRSGATIMGGLAAGMDRKTSTEFSFFLAIPVMFAATIFDMYKSVHLLSAGDAGVFAAGFISAFVSAIIVIYWFVRFISHSNFLVFAYYRIGFGAFLIFLMS